METLRPPRARPALALGPELLLALSAGVLVSLTFLHPFAWPAQILLAAWLAWRCAQGGPRRAALVGWAYGTAWLTAGTWWLYVSMHFYGGLAAPLAALAVLLLAAFLALDLALAMALYARLARGRPIADALAFAGCWLLAELARGVLYTGFPWVASGYAQADGPLAALAPWVGVYGIGAVLAFVAALLVPLVARPAAAGAGWGARVGAPALALLVVLVAAVTGPGEHSRPAGELEVSLLQTNVAQDDKFSPEHLPATLDWLGRALLQAPGELVVAPETAIPLLPAQLGGDYVPALQRHFAQPGRAALIGIPLGSYEEGYTNSVIGLPAAPAPAPEPEPEPEPAGGMPPYRYDKHHLVPFGEFVPPGFRWFVDLMSIPLGDFNRGPLVAPSFPVRGADGRVQRVAPNICYEDLFGEELAARFADPAAAPTVFANVSNIAWFGDTIAIAQHLQISRLRSLEFQRPMLRATNTGATVAIDHAGRVTAALPPFTRDVLTTRIEAREGLTPFARWASAAGLWPLVGLALLLMLPAAMAGRGTRPGT